MSTIQRLYDFTPGTKIRSDDIDAEFNQILERLNLLTDSVTDGASGADNIAATTITGLDGATVQAILESLKAYIETHRTSTDHDTRYYTEDEIDALLQALTEVDSATSTALTTHKTSTDHDNRYYTEEEIDLKLSDLSGTNDLITTALNAHKNSTDHDGRYYTMDEVNSIVTDLQGTDGVLSQALTTHKTSTDHDGRYYTETEINIKIQTLNDADTSLSTSLDSHKTSNDHDGRYYTESEIDQKITTLQTADTTGSNALNTHKTSNDHDGRYYTETEIDVKVKALQDADTALDERITTIVTSTSPAEVTDARISAVRGVTYESLDARLEAIEGDTAVPSNSTTQTSTAVATLLPSTTVEGNIPVTLKGNSLKQELNYTRDTWAEWTLGTGATADATGITLTGANATARANTQLKAATKYGVLFYTQNIDFSAGVFRGLSDLTGTYVTFASTTGNQKAVFTTQATIALNRFRIDTSSSAVGSIKSKDFRVFELPAGSEIEKDFDSTVVGATNLTADQLAVKYPYIKGDSVKSTLPIRVKSVGKNLFDKNSIVAGSYYGTNGVIAANATSELSTQYIPVNAGETIYVNSKAVRISEYDGNFNHLLRSSTGTTLVLSSSTKYIRIAQYQNGLGYMSDLVVARQSNITFEPYAESLAYSPADMVLRSIGTVKDENNVGTGEAKKSVGNVVYNGSEAWGGLFTSTNTYRIQIAKPADMSTGNGVAYGYCADGDLPTSLDPGADKRCVMTNSGYTYVYLLVEKAKIDAQTGADTLAKFKAYLNAFPVSVNYQLATPVPSTPKMPQNLIAYPNGSLIVDPYITDTGAYTDKVTLPASYMPISAMDFVRKVDPATGVKTDIALTSITVGTDKMFFTVTGASYGDNYEYGYFYDATSTTLPTLSYTYEMNLKAQVNSHDVALRTVAKDIDAITDAIDATNSRIDGIDKALRSSPVSVDGGIISLPSTVFDGGNLLPTLQGLTRNNLVKYSNMDKDSNADGIVDGFAALSNTIGAVLSLNDSAQKISISNSNVDSSSASIRQGYSGDPAAIPCAANEVVSARVDCKFVKGAGAPYARAQIAFYDSLGNALTSYTSDVVASTNGYTEIKIENKTAPANTAYVALFCRLYTSASASTTAETADVWFKNAMVEKAASCGNYIQSGIRSTGPVRVKATGKNLFDEQRATRSYDATARLAASWTGTKLKIDNTASTGKRAEARNSVYFVNGEKYTITKWNEVIIAGSAVTLEVTVTNTPSTVKAVTSGTEFTWSSPSGWYDVIAYTASGSTQNVELNITVSRVGLLTYEPYTESVAYTPADTVLRSVATAKDDVNLATGEAAKRDGAIVLQASDIAGMRTTYTNLDYARIVRPTGDTQIVRSHTLQDYSNLTWVSTFDDAAFIGKFTDEAETTHLWVGFAKGTTLAQAQAVLVGKTLTYQLANPITSAVMPPQPLVAKPNGMIVVEPYLYDVGYYTSSKITVTTPIKSIDFINKVGIKDGTFTPIPVANVTIAADGLSFTVTGAANGEYYEFGAFYDPSLTTLPTLVYTYDINQKAQVVDNTAEIAKLGKSVAMDNLQFNEHLSGGMPHLYKDRNTTTVYRLVVIDGQAYLEVVSV